MKDAIGSVFNLTLLFTFILIVTGFSLFGVNYYKAFKVKNELLTLIEKYEGNLNNNNFKEKVDDVINRYGYNPGSSVRISVTQQREGWKCNNGWCYRSDTIREKNTHGRGGIQTTKYYDVMTFVSTDIPVINRIMLTFDFFKVVGRTKPIRIR